MLTPKINTEVIICIEESVIYVKTQTLVKNA